MESLSKATIVDGIAATEGRDSQGEILKLAGADISQMVTAGVANDNHGTGFLNTLGKITEAKKIYRESDCENDRHRLFYRQAGKPYLYVRLNLFDDEGDHPNAKAVGAIMRSFQKAGMPVDVKFSVEGKVLERDRNDHSILARSMVKNVALTLVPANKETLASIAGDTNSVRKTALAAGADPRWTESLIKSISAAEQPRNRWDEPTLEERADTLYKKIVALTDLIKVHKKPKKHRHVKATLKHEAQRATEQGKVKKMLSPGYGGAGAPGQLTGGAALSRESLDPKRKALKEVIKSTLAENPGVSLSKALEMVLSKWRQRFG